MLSTGRSGCGCGAQERGKVEMGSPQAAPTEVLVRSDGGPDWRGARGHGGKDGLYGF